MCSGLIRFRIISTTFQVSSCPLERVNGQNVGFYYIDRKVRLDWIITSASSGCCLSDMDNQFIICGGPSSCKLAGGRSDFQK